MTKKIEQIDKVIKDFLEGGYITEYDELGDILVLLEEYRALVAKNLQQPVVSGSLHFPKQIYNFRCSKCWTQYDDAKAGCPKCNYR